MSKKHSDESPVTQLAREIHQRLEREYGHPVAFVLAAVDSDEPMLVDIATNSKDSQLFNTMLSALNNSPGGSNMFVIEKGGHA